MTTHGHPLPPTTREIINIEEVSVFSDRIRWGAILAGTFAALTALGILATLGIAIGLSSYDQGQDNPRNFAMGYGIWGIISTLLAFGFGGFLAARVANLRRGDGGLLNGMMVAAFGLPLLMFLVGSAGTLVGQAAVANDRTSELARADGTNTDNAITASARISADGSTNSASNYRIDPETARRTASRTAWGTLFTMVLALAAASFGGHAGARSFDDSLRDVGRGSMAD